MEEIKFKAQKQDSKEWVYGYYFEQKMLYGNHATIIAEVNTPNDWDDKEQINFHVKRETVARYTGLNDKNDLEIYENEIYHCNGVDYIVKKTTFGGAYTVHNLSDDKDERFLMHCHKQLIKKATE